METRFPAACTCNKADELHNTALVKILSMLLVVYCHSIALYMQGGWGPEAPARTSRILGLAASWLNTFPIYAFTAVSGYLFYYLRFELDRYRDSRRMLRHKALRLLLPYACASLLWVIPFDVRFWGFDAVRLVKDYVLMLNPCQLWFLPMLFCVFCIFQLLSARIPFDKLEKRAAVLWLLALYAINLVANLAQSAGVPNLFQILRALQFLLFFYIGMQLRRFDFSRLYQWKYILLSLLFSVLLFAFTQWLERAGAPLSYLRIPLRPLTSVCGLLFPWLLINKIARPAGTENGLYRLCSRSLFPIYLLHQQWIYVVITLLNHTGIAPYWLGEINFAVSFGLSLLMAWILGKWKVTRAMFGVG